MTSGCSRAADPLPTQRTAKRRHLQQRSTIRLSARCLESQIKLAISESKVKRAQEENNEQLSAEKNAPKLVKTDLTFK